MGIHDITVRVRDFAPVKAFIDSVDEALAMPEWERLEALELIKDARKALERAIDASGSDSGTGKSVRNRGVVSDQNGEPDDTGRIWRQNDDSGEGWE